MKSKPLTIGLLFDHSDDFPNADGPADRFAEFEPESTLVAMESALSFLGHRSIRIGSPLKLIDKPADVDLVWNIAEGYGTRNREAWAPVICEMRNIPYMGSDALTLGITLDKAITKQICRALGIPTADWQIQPFGDQQLENTLGFPVFLKPRYEGSAKGIGTGSVVFEPGIYKRRVDYLKKMYRQDVLVEKFLPGAEYTCAVAGNSLQPMPILQRALHGSTRIGLHAVESGPESNEDYHIHPITKDLEIQLQDWSLLLSNELEIKDYARIDFKLDSDDKPYFLEVNPLPTFAVDNTFAILAELEGRRYDEYLAGIIAPAIERAMDNRQWIMGNGQSAMDNGQWAIGNG